MNILLNNKTEELPDGSTIMTLVSKKDIPTTATAIALNGSLVKKEKWELTPLHEMDSVTVISAAYGG